MSPSTTKAESAWAQGVRDPQLQDLPYKIETNARGQLVLSPHTPYHSLLQSVIYDALTAHVEHAGRPITEFAVETADGVKVPDVVWISRDRLRQVPREADASPVLPELCIEVLSDSNTEAEMAEKRQLYIDAGAREVWVCAESGVMAFYDGDGQLADSILVPDFPGALSVDE
jgi:Uma2 family endonuclease